MSNCIEKLPHSCGTRNALQIFEKEDGTYDGYCFSCNTYVPDPYADKPKDFKPKTQKKSPEEVKKELKEIGTYRTLDLPDRKLKKEYLEYFGIKIGTSETNREEPAVHYYPYTKGNAKVAYKVRIIEGKKMFAIGSLKEADLFGWYKAKRSGARKLFITEGELDAVALYQIIKERNKLSEEYKDMPYAVVSLPTGAANAHNVLARHLEEIKRLFQEVILVFDMDDAGKAAAERCSALLPTIKVAHLPEKDVNDCLIKGRSKACFNAVMFNAEKAKNSRLVWGKDFHGVCLGHGKH